MGWGRRSGFWVWKAGAGVQVPRRQQGIFRGGKHVPLKAQQWVRGGGWWVKTAKKFLRNREHDNFWELKDTRFFFFKAGFKRKLLRKSTL